MPWAVGTEFVQEYLGNMTESMAVAGRDVAAQQGRILDEGRLIDEL